MRASKRRLLALAAVASVAAAASVAAGSAATGSHSRSLAGGTYRVGWESSMFNQTFPWTNGVRSDWRVRQRRLGDLHEPAPAHARRHEPHRGRGREHPRARPRHEPAAAHARRHDVHVHAQAGGQVRAAGQPRDHLGRRPLRDRAAARPGNGAIYASFRAIRGFADVRAGRAKTISGIVTPNAKTIMFNLTSRQATFPTAWRSRRRRRSRRRSGKCFEGQPDGYGRDLVSSGPYMIDGSDAVKIGSCAALRPMRGISDTQLTLVRNPRYDAKTDSAAARESEPDRFVFVVAGKARRDRRRSSRRVSSRTRTSTPSPNVLGRRGRQRRQARSAEAELVRFPLLHRDEPDPATVRRRARPPCDELGHGQGRASRRVGRTMAGSIAQHVVPDRCSPATDEARRRSQLR